MDGRNGAGNVGPFRGSGDANERARERVSEGSHAISSIGDYSSSLPPRRHHNVYHLLTAAKVFESWLENIEPKIFDGRGECI